MPTIKQILLRGENPEGCNSNFEKGLKAEDNPLQSVTSSERELSTAAAQHIAFCLELTQGSVHDKQEISALATTVTQLYNATKNESATTCDVIRLALDRLLRQLEDETAEGGVATTCSETPSMTTADVEMKPDMDAVRAHLKAEDSSDLSSDLEASCEAKAVTITDTKVSRQKLSKTRSQGCEPKRQPLYVFSSSSDEQKEQTYKKKKQKKNISDEFVVFTEEVEDSDSEQEVDTDEDQLLNPQDLPDPAAVDTVEREIIRCQYCFKLFADSNLLYSHEQSHTGDNPYKCSYCEKVFSKRCNFMSHIRSHSEHRYFLCMYCPLKFRSSSELKMHTAKHRCKGNRCRICGKFFMNKDCYNAHIRKHQGIKPFKCPECDKTFSRKLYLSRHLVTHTGDKRYTCSFCGHRCATGYHLKLHERQHTNDRPYLCKLCGKTYVRSHDLRKHEQVHNDPSVSGHLSAAHLTSEHLPPGHFSPDISHPGISTPDISPNWVGHFPSGHFPHVSTKF